MPVLPGLELIPPMLAAAGALPDFAGENDLTDITTVPAGAGWAFEFKYASARSRTSRTGRAGAEQEQQRHHSLLPRARELGQLLNGRRAVLGGEIVALEPGDQPAFARL